MIAYLDSSVLLRVVLQQPNPLPEWNSIDVGVVSALVHVEISRALDRLSLTRQLSADELATKTEAIGEILNRVITLELDQSILDIAAQPFPEQIATLDALHLATALIFRQAQSPDQPPLVIATHDKELAAAATAMDFGVIGVP